MLLAREPGLIFVPLGLLGIWTTVGRGEGNGLWNSLLALMLSDWLFHSAIYPISAHGYMLPAFVGLLLFCVAGLQWLAVQLHPRIPRARTTVAVVALLLFLATGFYIPKKPRRGFSEAADVMLTTGLRSNGTALVCSDPIGEGGFRFCGRDEGIVAANHRAPRKQISSRLIMDRVQLRVEVP